MEAKRVERNGNAVRALPEMMQYDLRRAVVVTSNAKVHRWLIEQGIATETLTVNPGTGPAPSLVVNVVITDSVLPFILSTAKVVGRIMYRTPSGKGIHLPSSADEIFLNDAYIDWQVQMPIGAGMQGFAAAWEMTEEWSR